MPAVSCHSLRAVRQCAVPGLGGTPARTRSTGLEAPSGYAARILQRSGKPSRFGRHTRCSHPTTRKTGVLGTPTTPADRGQRARMPCHAPLNPSGGNALVARPAPLLPCNARRTGRHRRGARKPNPPSRSSLAKDLVPLEPRAGVAQQPGCITAGFGLYPRDALRTSTLA